MISENQPKRKTDENRIEPHNITEKKDIQEDLSSELPPYPKLKDFPEKAQPLVKKAEEALLEGIEKVIFLKKELELNLKALEGSKHLKPFSPEELQENEEAQNLVSQIHSILLTPKEKKNKFQRKKNKTSPSLNIEQTGSLESLFETQRESQPETSQEEIPSSLVRNAIVTKQRIIQLTNLDLVIKLQSKEVQTALSETSTAINRELEALAESDNTMIDQIIVKLYTNSVNELSQNIRKISSSTIESETAEATLISSKGKHLIEKFEAVSNPADVLPSQLILKNSPIPILSNMLKVGEVRDTRLGQGEDIMFRNSGRNDGLKRILEAKCILSRREGIKKGRSMKFTQGSSTHPVFMDREGVTIGKEKTTWKTLKTRGMGIVTGMGKPPLGEFDQIVVAENSPYYDTGWAIVLPSREIRAKYQYSKEHDGVHIFPKNYDASGRDEEINTGYPDFQKEGANIPLDMEKYFLITLEKKGIDKWKTYLRANFSSLPHSAEFEDFELWYSQYVLEIDSLYDVKTVKETMFTRFEIPKYAGRTISTGNVSDSAASSMPTYKYVQ